MKSFLLTILGFFSVFTICAQEIPESKFIPQLEKKQKELTELLNEKNQLNIEVLIHEKNIKELSAKKEKTKEDEKALQKAEDDKKGLQSDLQSIENKITTKCIEYSEFQTFLAKYQNVAQKTLDKYDVRACELYKEKKETVVETTPEITAESNEDKVKNALETRQNAIDKLVDKKDDFDETIAEMNKNIKMVEADIKDAPANSQELENFKEDLKEKEKSRDSVLKLDAELKKQIMDSCSKFTEYKKFLKKHENVKDSILDLYKARNCRLFVEKDELDPEKYIIVGDNDPVKVDSLFSNNSARQVLASVFSIDSKTNLGTFEVPGDRAFVNFYAENNSDEIKNALNIENQTKDEESYALSIKQIKKKNLITPISSDSILNFIGEVPEGALFKSIQIELREGGIVDTRLVLHSIDGKFEFYFEGTTPVSILNYTRRVKKSFLKYSHYVSLDGKGVYNENALRHLLVKYTEVLDYHPNAGSNYVPDDVAYKFPSDKDKEAKETGRRSYQVINDSHLQHVLDLRTYTDLLGLFGDEANGLFQIEGKADFFIHPFNHNGTAFYYFKKVSPYVRYSRFDEDNDFIAATTPDVATNVLNPNTGDPADYFFFNENKLGLLERSNLEMGLDINLMHFRFAKELPFWMSVYLPFSYNVTKVQTTGTDSGTEIINDINFKTLGYGAGANIEIRRLNNFGLNVGYELKGYSFIGDYARNNLSEPSYLKTQAVKAEVFYYPGEDKSNSIFLRMKSIRDISSSGDDSFFQLQVGYRFTLGVGAIKAK
ncbi:hypothetical protein U8527_16305 [Kordia algicida OT-1]|uniref:Uncharacterized protein n=1 Tax=Kordia algicida OT-1 TaxID=391587 RepID=A9ECH5_9FLAO|nr:hypothetical protein [Kordia algicida]EDP94365.1 hypothetical protein KAOT1_09961 [Kordia algicida OT-1]